MPDLIQELIQHPDIERSAFELRAEFRAMRRAEIHSQLQSHPCRWGVLADGPARDRFDTTHWAMEMMHRLDSPVTQDFGLIEVPRSLGERLETLAHKAILHDSVTWDDSVEGTVDHDAPPCADVTTMTDSELCDYVDRAIQESTNG